MSPRTTTHCASPAWSELLAALPGPPTGSLCKAINTCFFPSFHVNILIQFQVSCVLLLVPRLPVSCHPAAVKQISVPPGYRGGGPTSSLVFPRAVGGRVLGMGFGLQQGRLWLLGHWVVADVLWSLFTCSAVTCQSCQDAAVFGGCIWQVPALSFVGSPSS